MAIYDAGYIGTATNRVTFNDFGSSPVFRVRSERPQQRDIRELDIPIPYESGVSDFETLIGEMAYVIEGTMYPGDEVEYDQGLRDLIKVASLDVSQNDPSSDDGYVPYVWTESNGNQKQLFVKVLYLNRRKDTRQGLVLPFELICKIKDPTIKGLTLKTASTQGVDPTLSSGSAILPFAFPVVVGASTGSVANTINNAGDIDAYPESIIINGPVNTPKVTNSATGTFIEISENLATSSDQIIITYDKDTLTVEKNGTSVLSSVTDDSTYFKLEPGDNTITLSGSSIGSGAYVTISAYDAYPLS